MINFRILNPIDKDFYEMYCKSYKWDTNHIYATSKSPLGFIIEFSQNFALYKDNKFIGYGSFNFNTPIDSSYIKNSQYNQISVKEKLEKSFISKVELSYIIKPEYRKMGYGRILLEYLIKEAKKIETINVIEVEIMKKNIASISLIKKFDFEFKYFNDSTIVFQKQLKNRF